MIFHKDHTLPMHDDWIWVFGSNLAGRHGKGAAKVARAGFKATYGIGCGPTGMAYAIPTKDEDLRVLPLRIIEGHINDFIDYTLKHSDKRFFVTRIGCELAGYSDAEIAPMFKRAPGNCSFATNWKDYLK